MIGRAPAFGFCMARCGARTIEADECGAGGPAAGTEYPTAGRDWWRGFLTRSPSPANRGTRQIMGRAIGTGPRYAPVIKPDTRVESWRRSSDRHNRRRHEHPRPPAATPQHTGHQLTGILLAAMIAGAHIAEARANIQSSSHRSANRRESDSGTEPARNATARASLRAALPPATLPQAGSRTALAAVPARDFQDAGGARQARSAAASLSPLAQ